MVTKNNVVFRFIQTFKKKNAGFTQAISIQLKHKIKMHAISPWWIFLTAMFFFLICYCLPDYCRCIQYFSKHFLSFSFLHLAKKYCFIIFFALAHTEREMWIFFFSSRSDSDYTAWNTGAKKKINSSCRFYERKIIGFFRRFKRSLKLKPLHSHTQCELRARYVCMCFTH